MSNRYCEKECRETARKVIVEKMKEINEYEDKYRIVWDGECYKIQKRVLHFFWNTVETTWGLHSLKDMVYELADAVKLENELHRFCDVKKEKLF